MWKPIPGFEGWYEASDRGQIRSVDRVITFSDGRIRPYKGRVLAQYEDGFGYKKVTLKMNGEGGRMHVHVLVAAAFCGPRPAGLQVRHINGKHTQNTPENLRYGTSKENHADTKRHGRAHRFKKLTGRQVQAIRNARGKATCRELAERYGTSPAHVCNIQLGRRRA